MGNGFVVNGTTVQTVINTAERLLAPGAISLSWQDINSILLHDGEAVIAFGSGFGRNRAIKACEDTILGYKMATGTSERPMKAVFHVTGPKNFSLYEVNNAKEAIDRLVRPIGEVIFGVAVDNSLDDEVRIVLLAGLERERESGLILTEKHVIESVQQATYLHSLAGDFKSFNQKFLEAWPVLIQYRDAPKVMRAEEWSRVADALTKCYQSVKFLYKISRLVKTHVVDSELLYILYYDEISGYLTRKLSFLIQWCGTGLDLAANYDSYEAARITTALITFLKECDAIHAEHGASLEKEGNKALIEHFEERTRDFLVDPGRFSVGSDDYVDNYIEIME
jgi:hypothetical protein